MCFTLLTIDPSPAVAVGVCRSEGRVDQELDRHAKSAVRLQQHTVDRLRRRREHEREGTQRRTTIAKHPIEQRVLLVM